jgi:uncharacterized membrane protein YbjE (DUF340 family)
MQTNLETAVLEMVKSAQSQIPDVVMQLVSWAMVSSIVGIVISLVLIGAMAYSMYWAWFKYQMPENNSYNKEAAREVVTVLVGIVLIGLIIGLISDMFTLIQLTIYPKAYLLEYVLKLGK